MPITHCAWGMGKTKHIPRPQSGASGAFFGLNMVQGQPQTSGPAALACGLPESRRALGTPRGQPWGATHLKVKRVPMSSIDSSSALDLGKESR